MESKLYIVPTPIGNLGDMTFRAVEVLKAVSLILAEDTRTSGKLLAHYGIGTPAQSYHQHNEHKLTAGLVAQIQAGRAMALITDAGTPGISDPGFLIVRACTEAGVPVECLPGATSLIPALVVSGLPCDRFLFEGFLPHKKGRASRIQSLALEKKTFVLFESPHRILKTLEQLAVACGSDRKAAVSREISKLHEETIRGSLQELVAHFSTHPPRGEFVLVVSGQD